MSIIAKLGPVKWHGFVGQISACFLTHKSCAARASIMSIIGGFCEDGGPAS